MAGLEEQVGLDISEALQQVDTLAQSAGEALEAAFSASVDSLSSLFATATSDLQDQLASALSDSAITVPVDADTTQATGSIDEVVAKADADTATIQVDADTADAQSAIDEVAASAEEATISLQSGGTAAKGFADNTALLSGAAGLAVGQVGGLGDVATGLGGGAAAAAGGVIALAGGVGVLFQKGLDATSALERFNLLVGDMGDKVLNVHVGTLNAQLDELAIKLGTDDEALRNASASLFQFAINSGASRDQAADFTNKVDALAARAVALNPALGSVADVAESMAVRLQRGGRFAAAFGLSLNANEIAARASGDANNKAAGDLSIFEKSQAAANIAVEKYGQTLGTTVAEGAKNAAIQQRSLKEQLDNVLEAAGKPLVVPILDAFEKALPAVAAIAQPLAEIAVDSIPILVAGLEALTPPLQLFADLIHALPPDVLIAGAAAVVLATSISTVVTAVEAGTIGLSSAIPVVGAFTAAYLLTSTILKTFYGRDVKDYDQTNRQFASGVADLASKTNAQLIPAFQRLSTQAQATGNVAMTPLLAKLRTFNDLAEQSPADAQRLIDALKAQGVNTEAYAAILDKVLTKQRDQRTAQQNAVTGNQLLADSYATPIEKAEAFVKSLQDEQKALDDLSNSQLGLAGAANSYAQSVQSQTEAQQAYNDAVAQFGPNSAEAQKAGLALNGANIDVGRGLLALDKAQQDANQTIGTASPDAIQKDIDHLRDLVAFSPAAAASLQPIIDKLQEQIDLHNFLAGLAPAVVTVTADTAQAETAIRNLVFLLGGLAPEQFGFVPFAVNAAAGEVVRATPGGQFRRVAEAGFDEIIVPANDPLRAANLLVQGGLGQLLAPRISTPASVGSSHHDQSMVVHIDARGAPDPVKVGKTAARKLRTAQYLGGWS